MDQPVEIKMVEWQGTDEDRLIGTQTVSSLCKALMQPCDTRNAGMDLHEPVLIRVSTRRTAAMYTCAGSNLMSASALRRGRVISMACASPTATFLSRSRSHI